MLFMFQVSAVWFECGTKTWKKKKKKVQSFLICSLTADSVLDPAAPDWKMDLFSLLRPVKSLILSLDVRSFKGHKEVAGTAVIEWGKAEKWLTLHCCCSPCSFSDVSDLNLLCVTNVLVWASVGWEADRALHWTFLCSDFELYLHHT